MEGREKERDRQAQKSSWQQSHLLLKFAFIPTRPGLLLSVLIPSLQTDGSCFSRACSCCLGWSLHSLLGPDASPWGNGWGGVMVLCTGYNKKKYWKISLCPAQLWRHPSHCCCWDTWAPPQLLISDHPLGGGEGMRNWLERDIMWIPDWNFTNFGDLVPSGLTKNKQTEWSIERPETPACLANHALLLLAWPLLLNSIKIGPKIEVAHSYCSYPYPFWLRDYNHKLMSASNKWASLLPLGGSMSQIGNFRCMLNVLRSREGSGHSWCNQGVGLIPFFTRLHVSHYSSLQKLKALCPTKVTLIGL